MVASLEGDNDEWTILLFSPTQNINAAFGYGTYRFESLRALDSQEHLRGRLFRTSLEEAVGIPITWSIDTNHREEITRDTALQFLKSKSQLIPFLSSFVQGKTNMSFIDVLLVSRKIQSLTFGTGNVIDLSGQAVTSEEILPDESKREMIDESKMKQVLGDAMNDTHIRDERLRVAVYNTTATPGLGQRFSRFIEQMGGYVVLVENETRDIPSSCLLVSSRVGIQSKLVAFLHEYFHCDTEVQEDMTRADLDVFVGKGYEQRFLPLE